MQFESQKKRNFWFNYAVRIVLEYIVIYILLKMFQSNYDNSSQFGEAFIGLFILWAAEIVIGLKNSLLIYGMYKFKGKDEGADELLTSFKKMDLPQPGEYYLDADGYIDDVLKDEKASQDAKNFVSMIYGILSAYRANQMMLRGGLYQATLEEAIKRYQASFR